MGFERQLTRRAVLRAGSRLAILSTVSALYAAPRMVRAQPYALRATWEQSASPLGTEPLVSPPLRADFAFNAIESRWDASVPAGASLDFAVRTSADGTTWSDWTHLHADMHARDAADTDSFGDLVIIAPAQYAQYAITAQANARGVWPSLRRFAITAVNTLISAEDDTVLHAEAFNGTNIVPRSGWGADEKLRLDKDGKEIWPPEYRTIQKVIIHHTATRDPETDPQATLRAIYQYHAASRGWGDIGYNFLIDQQGTVYEGRHGGDRVVGGHALQYNWGSIGIAVLGTYSDHAVPAPARAALLALIKAKAGDLDPIGKSFFIDRDNVMNISGHRGVIQTNCPGEAFYPTLNNIRRELKGLPLWTGTPESDPVAANPPDAAVTTPVPDGIDGALTDVTWGATTLYMQDLLTVKITVKNTGKVALLAQDPPPSFIYTEGDTYAKRGYGGIKNGVRVAIGPELTASSDPPYRWGLGKTLPPGESTTVQVAIRPVAAQKSRFVAVLMQEGGGPLDQDDAVQITIQPSPADPAQPSNDPAVKYFAQTKHNIGADFSDYWQASGGLAQFGFPITEPFTEVNPDDGKPYKVQYFERARFEAHPEKAGTPYAVLLGRLGAIVTKGREGEKPFLRVARADDGPDRRFFPESGHTLSGVFKTYWDAHGGLPIFGLPLCEPFEEKSGTDGKTYTVQYFERNRFEHHPENTGTPQEILLGLLGSEIVRRRGWLS